MAAKSMRSRMLGAGAVVVVGTASGCGFGEPSVCDGPAVESPHVAVDTAAWTAAHPDTHVQACLDGVCELIAAGTSPPSDGTHLYLGGQDLQQPVQVVLHATRAGVTILSAATTVRLQEQEMAGPCAVKAWAAAVVLDATGALRQTQLPGYRPLPPPYTDDGAR